MEGIFYFVVAATIAHAYAATAYSSPSLKLKFTLGNNVVINPNISSPKISPDYFKLFKGEMNNWKTKGKYVQYIDICLLKQNFQVCPIFHGANCGWQFLDTDSDFSNQLYFQNFYSAEIQQYQLSFDWISEISYLIASTGISVYWNGVLVDSFYDSNCTLHTSTYYVRGKVGLNQFAFEGIGLIDNQGILLRNIKLQVVNYIYPNDTPNNYKNSTSNNNLNISNPNSSNQTSDSTTTLNDTQGDTQNTTQNNTIGNSSKENQIFNSNSSYKYTTFDDLYQFKNSSSYKSLLRFFQFATKYQFTNFCRYLFGSQENIRFLIGFLMEFNHLIPYNYHIRNLTLMSNFILVNVQALDDQKGYLTDYYIYPMLGISATSILEEFSNRISLNTNANNIFTQYIKRPNGILLEMTDFLMVDVPVTLIMFLIGYALFRLLFHFRISIILRQYSLFGVFFLILLNGKIEILTFHYLSELLHFFSECIEQKIFMVLIVFFYFFVFIISIGLMMLYKSSYKNLVKFIYENCRYHQNSMLFMTINFGVYNLALGFTHRLLLDYPNQQICVLLLIEIVYLIVLITLMAHSFFQNLLMSLILCIMNLLRIIFIVSCFVYSENSQLESEMSYLQEYVFYALIAALLASIAIGLLEKAIVIFKIIVRFFAKLRKNPNKIAPQIAIKTVTIDNNTIIKQKNILESKSSNFSLTIESIKQRSFKKATFTRVDRIEGIRIPHKKLRRRSESFKIQKNIGNISSNAS